MMAENAFATRAHRLLAPRVAYLIGTSTHDGRPNLIPVSNVTSVSTDPQHVAVAVFKEWDTCRAMTSSPGFALSVPVSNQLEAVWKLGAKYSRFPFGSTEEKLRASGIDWNLEMSGYGPVVLSGIGWMSCRTIARIDLAGDHVTFIGEVEAAWFNPEFLHPDGTPISAVRPVMQQTGNRFTTAGHEMWTMDYFRK
ncbi:flavin reductase family protein [Nocardia sp. NPDC004568]|uniref:flavin reductase family protein n=1 Tax=Nocardia sp. NPDC004568 TaxID=3154551 RepID=UPI0033BC98E0